jgi:hypothetical protein
LIGGVLSFGLFSVQSCRSDLVSPIKLDFETIEEGWFSGFAQRASLVIKDEVKWSQIWNQHTSYHLPPPELPKVDFQHFMVIAVFRGTFPTSGYSTTINELSRVLLRINVLVVERDPKDLAYPVITHPYHIIMTEKVHLPVEFVYKREIR